MGMHIRWQLAALVAIPLLLATASGAFAVAQMREVTQGQEAALLRASDAVASSERLRGLATQESAQIMGYMRGAASLDEVHATRAAFAEEVARMRDELSSDDPMHASLLEMERAEAALLAPPAGGDMGLFDTVDVARGAQEYAFEASDKQFPRLAVFYDAFGNVSLNRTSGPVWNSLGIQRSGITEFEYALNGGGDAAGPIARTKDGHVAFTKFLAGQASTRLDELERALPSEGSDDARAAIAAAKAELLGYDANGTVAHAQQVAASLKAAADASEAAGATLLRAELWFPPYAWTVFDNMGALLVEQHAIQQEAATFFDLSIVLRDAMEGSLTTRSGELRDASAAAVLAAQAEVEAARARVETTIASTQGTVLGAIVLAVVPSAAVSIVVVRRISRRLHSFDSAAAAVGRGEFMVPPPPPENDEFDALADSWSTMTGALAAREAEIRQKNVALVQNERLASLGSLIAGVAHEVNNPLAFVKANEEMVADELRTLLDREELRSDPEIGRILDDAISAMAVNRDGIMRVEQVSLALKGLSGPSRARSLIDLNEVSDGVLILAHATLRNKLQVRKKYSILPKVYGESRELGQVVLNLVKNAAQASPQGGTVEIFTRSDAENVYLTVADHGPGVPEEIRSRLFEAFATTKQDGSGLGLHISRAIARGHGGDLFLEDTEAGAAFTLRLPLGEGVTTIKTASPEAAPRKAEPPAPGAALAPRAKHS